MLVLTSAVIVHLLHLIHAECILNRNLVYEQHGDVIVTVIVNSKSDNYSRCTDPLPAFERTQIGSAVWIARRLNDLDYFKHLRVGLKIYDLCEDEKVGYNIYLDAYLNRTKCFNRFIQLPVIASATPAIQLESVAKFLNYEIIRLPERFDVRHLIDAIVKFVNISNFNDDLILITNDDELEEKFLLTAKSQWICMRKFYQIRTLDAWRIKSGLLIVFGTAVDIQTFLNLAWSMNAQNPMILIPLDGKSEYEHITPHSYILLPYFSDIYHYNAEYIKLTPSPIFLNVAAAILHVVQPIKTFLANYCNYTTNHVNCINLNADLINFELGASNESSTLTELGIESVYDRFNFEFYEINDDFNRSTFTDRRRAIGVMKSQALVNNDVGVQKVAEYNIFNYTIYYDPSLTRNSTVTCKDDHNECLSLCANFNPSINDNFMKFQTISYRLKWTYESWVAALASIAIIGLLASLAVLTFISLRMYKDDVLEGNPTGTFVLLLTVIFMYLSIIPFMIDVVEVRYNHEPNFDYVKQDDWLGENGSVNSYVTTEFNVDNFTVLSTLVNLLDRNVTTEKEGGNALGYLTTYLSNFTHARDLIKSSINESVTSRYVYIRNITDTFPTETSKNLNLSESTGNVLVKSPNYLDELPLEQSRDNDSKSTHHLSKRSDDSIVVMETDMNETYVGGNLGTNDHSNDSSDSTENTSVIFDGKEPTNEPINVESNDIDSKNYSSTNESTEESNVESESQTERHNSEGVDEMTTITYEVTSERHEESTSVVEEHIVKIKPNKLRNKDNEKKENHHRTAKKQETNVDENHNQNDLRISGSNSFNAFDNYTGDLKTYSNLICSAGIFSVSITYTLAFSVMLSRAIMVASVGQDGGFMSHINGYIQTILCFFIAIVQVGLSLELSLLYHECSTIYNGNMFIYLLSYDIFLLAILLALSPFLYKCLRNYREGSTFSIAIVLLVIVWFVWVGAYMWMGREWKKMIVASGLVASATVLLVTVFIPRTYLMLSAIVRDDLTSALPTFDRHGSHTILDVNYRSNQALYDCVNPMINTNANNVSTLPLRGHANPNFYATPENGQCTEREHPETNDAGEEAEGNTYARYETPPSPNKITRF